MLSVLVIENERGDAQIVRNALQGKPVDLNFVATAFAAREFLKINPVEVILLDLLLPNGEGATLTESIAEHKGDAVIIITTRLDDAVTCRECMHAGASDFIVKDEISQHEFDLFDRLIDIHEKFAGETTIRKTISRLGNLGEG